MNRLRTCAPACLAGLLALLSARASFAQVSDSPAWPPPPAAPRVRFLESLTPDSIRPRPSALSRVLRFIAGSEPPRHMAQPYGVAVGQDRRIYVADTVGGLIHVYDVERHRYSTIRVDATSLIGIAALGPRLVVTDSVQGRVICLDARGRVQWRLGPKDGFARPTGIVAAGDQLWVVDTTRHLVARVSAGGKVLGTFGTRGTGPGQFNFPTNITRGADGRLFVTDTLNFRVQVLDPDGHPLTTFGRPGDTAGDFDKAKGIALDSAGHVYVVEGLNDVVQIYEPDGRLLLVFGGSGAGAGQLWLPSGITIANDIVYVADAANQRVQMFEYVKERP